ncbi:MAG: flagellar protein [Clostridia bacterium]|nr:flagellar protein [Clostridia bacterium]
MGLQECEFCGLPFHSVGSNLCGKCAQRIDEDFLKARKYIYKHGDRADFASVVENTGVDEKVLRYLIRQGRVQIADEVGGAQCRICGKRVTNGALCVDCMQKFQDACGNHEPMTSADKKRAAGISPLSRFRDK